VDYAALNSKLEEESKRPKLGLEVSKGPLSNSEPPRPPFTNGGTGVIPENFGVHQGAANGT
jgi:hypothetical protein